MDFLVVRERRWRILAPAEVHGEVRQCRLLSDLERLAGSGYRSAVQGMFRILNEYAENGPSHLPRDWHHRVDAERDIHEFIKGDLRVLYFVSRTGTTVICSHVLLKKSQKTPAADRDRAFRLKRTYEASEDAGRINTIEGL